MSNIYKDEIDKKEIYLPLSIDEYISENNQVRAVEDFVEMLDMVELGFVNSDLKATDGQPAYHPKLLLKIYIYGYLNKIRSSRALEREIGRNIEMMWLCGGLYPKQKTIANFRKNNSKALEQVFKDFVTLCKELQLIEGKLVGVDGAFLRANASKNRLITKKFVTRDLKRIEEKIDKYFKMLTFSDKEPQENNTLRPSSMKKIIELKIKKKKLDEDLALLEEKNVEQYNRTDPDAKNMVKPAHNLMAYNVQIAVDDKYKFIVATDVTSQGNDFNQLSNMGGKAKEVVQNDDMVIVGDGGYCSAKEISKCKDAGIEVVVPVPKNEKKQKDKGFYLRSDFIYDEESDTFTCPNQQQLIKSPSVIVKTSGKNYIYTTSGRTCKDCPLRDKCIPKKTRNKRISVSEYASVAKEHLLKMQTDEAKEIIKKRGSIVEHPFGTIKQNLGWSHFLVRGKKKVMGENALIMFTYNFRRLLNLIGIVLFKKLLKALKNGNIEDIRAEIEAYITLKFYIWLYFVRVFELERSKGEKLLFRLL
jgi:transposase